MRKRRISSMCMEARIAICNTGFLFGERLMKFVSISQEFFDLCNDDEMLKRKGRRPHVLVLSLLYKGQRLNFAVPLRSNIPPAAPKEEYFPLPPRACTQPRHRHGLHYIKMFPITKQYQEKFWVGENSSYCLFQRIITENRKKIVSECQDYLNRYAAGEIPQFAVDIDNVLNKLGLLK